MAIKSNTYVTYTVCSKISEGKIFAAITVSLAIRKGFQVNISM